MKKLVLFTLFLGLFELNIMAQKIEFKPTGTPFTFKLLDGKDDQSVEPSAVETIDKDGKYLLVLDDKSEDESPQNLRIINLKGELLARFVVPDAPDKPKWEAITKDGDGFFYLIGSHAAKDADTAKKLAKRSRIFRFKMTMNDDPSKIVVDAATKSEFDIKSSLKDLKIYTDAPSEKNVKIEGLAVQVIGCKKHLIFGLREPSALTEIYSAELPPEKDITKDSVIELTLKPYFRFDAGTTSNKTQLKLSSIEYAPDLKGFLLLTSSETTIIAANREGKPVFHGNVLWFVGDEQIKTTQTTNVKAEKISEFEPTIKAEGFCLLPSNDQKITRLAVVYDNDTEDFNKAKAGKIPLGMLQLVELLHK